MSRRLLPAAALAALALLAFGAAALNAPSLGDPGATGSASVYDDGPGGAGALRAYLAALGARTTTLEGERFEPGGADTVFVLGPTEPVTSAEAAALATAARGGATIVLALDRFGGVFEGPLLEAAGIRAGGLARDGRHAAASALLLDPPVRSLEVDLARELRLGDGAFGLTEGERPIAAYRRVGSGLLVVVGTIEPFVGAGLARADNARFAAALAAAAIRDGSAVAFDEYHHGVHPAPNALALLTTTWPGRTLLASGLIAFGWLALSGRRLGPPLPLDPRPPRSSLEYVRGLAALVRRAGHTDVVRLRLRRDLQRGIARLVGLDPALPFARLAESLAARDAARAGEARTLDASLDRPGLRDAELLRTVAAIERVTRASEEAV